MQKSIYLDNAATTKVLKEVSKAVIQTMEKKYANPSSLHSFGLKAEKILENSRKIIANYLGVKTKEITFTSGGTESNNLAVRGVLNSYRNRGKHIICSEVEHASVFNLFEKLKTEGWKVDFVKVNNKGVIDLDHLQELITDNTILVSIMHVNNELGTIEPIEKIAEIIKEKNPLAFFHVDGIQALGKLKINLKNHPIDLYSISGHKIHAPKGIGALYIKNNINLTPLIYGGGQEKNLRSGTENIPGIAGFAAAVNELPKLSSELFFDPILTKRRNYLIDSLKEIKEVKINSPLNAAPHIINFSIPGIKGETMLHALEAKGVYLSTGSACSSKSSGSRILKACALPQEINESALRVSLNREITNSDLDYFIKTLKEQINFLKLF